MSEHGDPFDVNTYEFVVSCERTKSGKHIVETVNLWGGPVDPPWCR